jgi:CRISPR-associated protein Csx17
VIVLDGCRTEPLGSYLQGLGAWRALVRLGDPDALACWRGGRLVLDTRLTEAELVALLRDRFMPLPIVSPWNAGSGFAGNGKNVEAERALAAVRESADARLAHLRQAVLAADEVVRLGRASGWAGRGDELWDKAKKPDVLRLCRNILPDAALAWLDAVAVLGQDRDRDLDEVPTYSRLLGTGGNFGRQDLQSTYVQRALTVLLDKTGRRNSEGWLRAALFGEEGTPYLRETVGQFDPGRAGGIQSSPAEKADDSGFANPWSFLLTIEGALLFAAAATRRQGALNSGAAVPFVVRTSVVGFGSSASDETAYAEIWTPEWDRPATLPEIEHLLGEGRADWNGRPARSGLDFARAVATLGVDRGLRRFTRSVFAERLGQNPLAVPVGVIEVTERGGVGLLGQLDLWLEKRLRRSTLPAAVASQLRQVDEAMYRAAARGGPAALRSVLVAVGRLHEAVSRSGRVTERVRPLTLIAADRWWEAIAPEHDDEAGAAELRLAAALASGRDRGERNLPTMLRQLLTPVAPRPGGRDLGWAAAPPVPSGAGTVHAIAEAHRRRATAGTVKDPLEDDRNDWPEPAVRGVFSAFRDGLSASLADVAVLVAGELDDAALGDYLRGLLLFDWPSKERQAVRVRRPLAPILLEPALAVLLPFYASRPLRVRLEEDDPGETDLVLRPGSESPGCPV